MAKLKVLKYPDKVLKTKALLVKQVNDEVRRLVKDMIETMYVDEGVGLAANQVGVLKQIFVASPDQKRGNELVFINPRIVKKQGSVKEFEGCLSVPELYEPVRRSKCVWIEAMSLDGTIARHKGEGLLARIFQHEIDHLNGVLFIDRLSFIKRQWARRKLKGRTKS